MRNEILQRHRQSLLSGSSCSVCGGLSQPAVRTRNTAVGAESILYLAEARACSVCGRQWEDGTLRRLNGRAADAARTGLIAKTASSRPPPGAGQEGTQPSFPKAHFASGWRDLVRTEADTAVTGEHARQYEGERQ
jgi:hypothetical protein